MKAEVTIERIDREHIHVAFKDPFGHGDFRTPLALPDDLTAENLEFYVMRKFPLKSFEARHHTLTRALDPETEKLVGKFENHTFSVEIVDADEPAVD